MDGTKPDLPPVDPKAGRIEPNRSSALTDTTDATPAATQLNRNPVEGDKPTPATDEKEGLTHGQEAALAGAGAAGIAGGAYALSRDQSDVRLAKMVSRPSV